MDETPPPRRDDPASRRPGAGPCTPAERRVWRSEDLLGDGRVALIRHGEQTYQLRQTRNGKLILT